jgi:hypothetical protein
MSEKALETALNGQFRVDSVPGAKHNRQVF